MKGINMRMRILLTVTLACLSAAAGLAADAKAGQAVYERSCKSCHGVDGTANPAIAKMMKVEIRDLKSPEVQALSDSAIKAIITAGKGKMQPVRSVTPASADDVVAYLRTWKK